MRLKKIRILVEGAEETNKRWKKALKGKTKTDSNETVITVSNFDILGKIFSPQKLQILSMIPVLKPKSIADLSRQLKRDFKNVHSDVKFLADIGLIDLLEKGTRKTLVPVAKYKKLELPLSA